jgi:hypothetical protein
MDFEMQPELAYGYLTKSVYVVTRWARPGVAQTKYDITDQFHVMARRLGYERTFTGSHSTICNSVAGSKWQPCNCGATPDDA